MKRTIQKRRHARSVAWRAFSTNPGHYEEESCCNEY
jgi:hypothetical protein